MFPAPATSSATGSLPAFIRAWLLRLQKRIILSSVALPEVSHKLQDEHLPPAQRLPDEVILEILGYIIPAVRDTSFPSSPAENSAVSITQTLARHQTYLAWASRTCRGWYSAGTEVLYASPLLLTTRKMELFERTLSNEPSLSRFVKAIYAPIHTGTATSELLAWVFGRRTPAVQKAELSTMLQHCPAVRTLTIRHTVRKGAVSSLPVQDVLRAADVAARLEALTLHGSTFEARWNPQFCVLTAFADTLLPALRVLCLRGLYVLPSLRLPPLPRLHTLRLAANHYFGAGPYFRAAQLPALRTLELEEHSAREAQLKLASLVDEECILRLQRLRVVQDERCMVATRALPADGELRALEIGMLAPRDHTDTVCWCIPASLESLTFIVGAEAGVDVEDCLDAIFRCLRLNEEAKKLKEVAVVYNLAREAPRLDILENTLEELRALCRNRDISFRTEALHAEDTLIAQTPHLR
ncbi:hypothetical protein PsYK624_059230 [Phanerochaete sordida]|uniref:F-box domain-containing protein n=1 Tax=Phanerochaete sordida TaxID=48140 RepID=A0A9P3LC26_9APHY|nr:hypothetical protein PsYK624_059230 [Phanerochaete sordida]